MTGTLENYKNQNHRDAKSNIKCWAMSKKQSDQTYKKQEKIAIHHSNHKLVPWWGKILCSK